MGVVAKQSKKIEGITYTAELFSATEGLTMGPWLVKVFGAPLLELVLRLEDDEAAKLLDDLGSGTLGNDVITAMASTVISVCQQAEPGEIANLFKATFAKTEFVPEEGQKPASVPLYFDTHFAGRYMHMVNVFIWVVRASFVRP